MSHKLILIEDHINDLIVSYGSLRAVARAYGVDPGNLSKWRANKTKPTPANAKKIGLIPHVVYTKRVGFC